MGEKYTLAHRGVLFMDELPEFNRTALEALRMPLEDGEVLVSRAAGSVRLPADCMVVAAMNPCPCGLAGDPDRECTCTAQRLHAYRTRISGPLLDRFDLRVEAPRAEAHAAPGEPSAAVGTRVAMARQRLDEAPPPLGGAAAEILARAVDQMLLSGRGADRARRVAVTIAALDGAETVSGDHMAEALSFRGAGG
jgi:magnesium chelatase family protein